VPRGKTQWPAAVRMAMDMLKEKTINKETAVMRVTPSQLDELLHPIIDPKVKLRIGRWQRVYLPDRWGNRPDSIFRARRSELGKTRQEGNFGARRNKPEDVEGMRAAQAVLTARGGMTSHAALVARGWGKCCIVGCGALHVDYEKKELNSDGKNLKEGDWVTLNGTKGNVYEGQLPMMDATEENQLLADFLKVCDSIKRLGIRTNAILPKTPVKQGNSAPRALDCSGPNICFMARVLMNRCSCCVR